MAPLFPLSVLLLAGSAAAGVSNPVDETIGKGRTCKDITIPIRITARLGVFPEIPATGNLDVTAFVQDFSQQGRNYSASILQGYKTVGGKYEISAKYCHPNVIGSTIQILSHGIGFDKSYWDIPYDNYQYSYTNVALKHGYSTLAIDRLGIGNSSHGDPINEIQAQLEVEALNAVTTKLRGGMIDEIDSGYDKIVHVGHSFGSVQSYWLSALYPHNTDGLVLTGWSANGSFLASQTVPGWNLHSARLNQPFRFGNASNDKIKTVVNKFLSSTNASKLPTPSQKTQEVVSAISSLIKKYAGTSALLTQGTALFDDIWNDLQTTELGDITNEWNTTAARLDYPPGYLTHSDLTTNQFVFLHHGNYDIGLGVYTENNKQPVTIGELLTVSGAPAQSNFAGPVMVFTGEFDQPFCGFDCYATGGAAESIPAQGKMAFPRAGAFEAYVQPNTGHGINAHFNSSAGNDYVQRWLGGNGLDS